jgi:hypothetical protein
MTKIYIYCLFDHGDVFKGVYSSLQAVHRDAIKLANKGRSKVVMEVQSGHRQAPSLTALRNTLKGQCDVQVRYAADPYVIKIIKTKLKE